MAIIEGRVRVGLDENETRRLGDVERSRPIKTSRRDLAYVVSQGRNGGTTVSGTMLVAAHVGIPVFATGGECDNRALQHSCGKFALWVGIGGVHRGGESTLDVSADLTELGRSSVAVVSSGVKSILDVPRTLEYLVIESSRNEKHSNNNLQETQGVFVAAFAGG